MTEDSGLSIRPSVGLSIPGGGTGPEAPSCGSSGPVLRSDQALLSGAVPLAHRKPCNRRSKDESSRWGVEFCVPAKLPESGLFSAPLCDHYFRRPGPFGRALGCLS